MAWSPSRISPRQRAWRRARFPTCSTTAATSPATRSAGSWRPATRWGTSPTSAPNSCARTRAACWVWCCPTSATGGTSTSISASRLTPTTTATPSASTFIPASAARPPRRLSRRTPPVTAYAVWSSTRAAST